jgi:predicted RNA-binding protein
MEEKETPNKLELPDDDYVVFIPDKDLRSIERAINRMEQARQELHKIRESLNNGELRSENGE